ncbi:PKD domain-containing protein [Brumimicrobium aurantiacum]|uniref:PKD domain-containing protein n=1 Tax=Brumimicrobium aurantiacum TaxID=1737063 RepID=A0A3E1EUC9_9FLAO|nr:PKD domain-containing protein [Brumimicrobium aurantiacum]RFC53164.1 hypothetical protein DXU93_14485 [Brumimicrobium aurantiacum]
MKDNLEKAFKESLESYEAPYDEAAWSAMNAKLNARSAAKGTGLASVYKWGLSIILLSAVITGSYFLIDKEDEVKPQQAEAVTTEKVTPQTETNNEEKKTSIFEETSKEVEKKDDVESSIKIEDKKPELNEKEVETQSEVSDSEPVKDNTNDPQKDKLEKKNEPQMLMEPAEVTEQYVAGLISNTTICTGESIEIRNDSKDELVRFSLGNNWVVLKAGENYNFKPTEHLVVAFVNQDLEVIAEEKITVNALPSIDFKMEANIFEEGMPVVNVESYGDYKAYNWSFDGESTVNGASAKHHFFNKGDYDITLNVTDLNGCKNSISKSVHIRDKFNLMAVDAFKPTGSDIRNKTFMPYSLTEREVQFKLTIIDPVDNGIVFTSTDATNAWDGTDQRTGKLTESNKSFIWKVQIFNPAPNERPIYAGTVVHN